jgi:hypothetical protein
MKRDITGRPGTCPAFVPGRTGHFPRPMSRPVPLDHQQWDNRTSVHSGHCPVLSGVWQPDRQDIPLGICPCPSGLSGASELEIYRNG